ncbi:MAG: endo-1,4-beta-xylanase [Clostridia bacterium]|nr:endo-1,4-beta-xylanase [Clostridia bacterium]
MARRNTALRYFDEQRDENAKRTAEDTEKYRKGECEMVFESNGALPSEITVEAKQTSHEFKFGANLFMLDEFSSGDGNALYREKFPELFNLATLPFYWNTTEPEEGRYRFDKGCEHIYRRPAIDLCLEYCKEKGVEPKLHCLNYDAHSPEWTWNLSVPEIKEKLENRFRVISERYGSVIPSVEVTNETLMANHKSPFFMEDDFLEWSYRKADKYFPNNKLIINDYNIWDPTSHNRNYYYMQIERLLRNGITHLDTIGMQFHCFFPREAEERYATQRFNPKRLRELFDLFARFGRELQITEMTIPAYGNGEEDEAVQAELTENLYRVLFSYPSMNAIIYWNLVDGCCYQPNGGEPGDMTKGENVYHGGFLRFDMSEKPVYKALYKLINEEWRTNTAVAARDGKACFRGFYGGYDLKIHAGDRTVERKIYLSKGTGGKFTVELPG